MDGVRRKVLGEHLAAHGEADSEEMETRGDGLLHVAKDLRGGGMRAVTQWLLRSGGSEERTGVVLGRGDG